MRTIPVWRDEVKVEKHGKSYFFILPSGEMFPTQYFVVQKFKRMKQNRIKLLVDSKDWVRQVVSLDYEPLDNYRVATIIKEAFGETVKWVEWEVDEMHLWVRGYFPEFEVKNPYFLGIKVFNRNDSYHAFRSFIGVYNEVCGNLNTAITDQYIVRIVHTWDEIKYQNPIRIIKSNVNKALSLLRTVFNNVSVYVFTKEQVKIIIEGLRFKKMLPKYAVSVVEKQIRWDIRNLTTNWELFNALTYLTSNILFLRKRFDLIDKLDRVAFNILVKPIQTLTYLEELQTAKVIK